MLLLACALCGTRALPAAAQPAEPRFDLNVERIVDADGGKVYQVASNGTVSATPAAAWRVLTDYNRFADYVPNLKSARVVSRSGDTAIVEQLGAARFLFFSQDIHLTVQVHERPPYRIDLSLIDGDMKVYRASWELTPLPGAAGTRLAYRATIEPKFPVPGMVGTSVIRRDIAGMMAAVFLRMDQQE